MRWVLNMNSLDPPLPVQCEQCSQVLCEAARQRLLQSYRYPAGEAGLRAEAGSAAYHVQPSLEGLSIHLPVLLAAA